MSDPTGPGSRTVLLADDQPDVRSAIRLVVEQLVGYRIVAEAACATELVERAADAAPDVVLLDWELPEYPAGRPVDSAAWLGWLRERVPGTRVIALSARYGARDEALRAGADAFVSKGDPPRKLIETLDRLW